MTHQLALPLTAQRVHRSKAVMAAADAAGARGIALGLEKAQRVSPDFIARACDHIKLYLRDHGRTSGEILTDSCKMAGIVSTDDRHFGGVFRKLLDAQQIRRVAVGVKRSKGHGSAGGSAYELVAAAP